MRHHFIIAEFFDAYDELTPDHIYSIDLLFTNFDLRNFGNVRTIEGSISNRYIRSITSLNKVERITHDLEIDDNSILSSLGNLKNVDGNVHIRSEYLKSLGNLTRVEGCVSLDRTKITSLGNLEYVGDFLSLYYSDITSLGKLRHVNVIYCNSQTQYDKLQSENKRNFRIVRI